MGRLLPLKGRMIVQLILCEKPSVGRTIAAVLGAKEKKDGFIVGEGVIVSWCIGHLVEFAPADIYDERYAKWNMDDLPILLEKWETVVSMATKKQFLIVKQLMNHSSVESIICATDAGREGELIFRLVYEKAKCKKPVKRLWISSLEENAIREGFAGLHDSKEYDALYQSALCRAQADWLVGINATRLYSLHYGETYNVGRVMSPTLSLIVQREKEIAAFVCEPYYKVTLDCGFIAQSERLADKAQAEQMAHACRGNTAIVKAVDKKAHLENPPKLYDLTSLQREANRMFGYTAQQTLDYAQALYEKRLITYPRTDSRYLTQDMILKLPVLAQHVATAMPFATGLALRVQAEQVIDDGEVTDHHAIIPTQTMTQTDIPSLPAGERDILHMIATRLLCAVSEIYHYTESIVTLDCAGHLFTAKGESVDQMGWKVFEATYHGSLGRRIQRIETPSPLPPLSMGQKILPQNVTMKQGKTSPPKRYTEDTLLAAMENAGADRMPENAERKGLGTPATRAGILEKLVAKNYVARKGDRQTKALIPTSKGKRLINLLPERLTSPALTAEWETQLCQIEHGELDAQTFMNSIRTMVTDLVTTSSKT